jgi:hypothetical protein
MKTLKSLIQEMIHSELKLLLEKDAMDLAADATPAPEQQSSDNGAGGDIEQIDASGGGLEDLTGDTTAAGPDTPEGSDTTSTPDATTGDPTSPDDATEPDFGGDSAGGGFGSGSAFGGGGGSSGGFDFGGDSETDSEGSEEQNGEQTQSNALADSEAEISDPITTVVDIAKELRMKTGDAQQILNSVKSAIQERFNNFDEALPIIQSLWDTNEPVLQVVARKLIMFIKGS